MITYGRGRAVVTATGMGTEFGRIAQMLEEVKAEETPLERRMTMVYEDRALSRAGTVPRGLAFVSEGAALVSGRASRVFKADVVTIGSPPGGGPPCKPKQSVEGEGRALISINTARYGVQPSTTD